MVGIDPLSFQKHLYYLPMSALCPPTEWCPAMFGICLVGIDLLLLQTYLYYLLMAIHSRSHQGRPAICGDYLIGIDVSSFPKYLHCLFMPALRRQLRGVRPCSVSARSGLTSCKSPSFPPIIKRCPGPEFDYSKLSTTRQIYAYPIYREA